MLCERFAESWFNGEHTVARRKLSPFCLWHYVYLQFVNSPLAPDAAQYIPGPIRVGWEDLELAARICQLEYPRQLPVKQSLAGRIALQGHIWRTMAGSTLEKEDAAFDAYLDDYLSPPQFNTWKEDHPGRQRGSPPDPLAVASAVIMLFGGGPAIEKFVWEMPIGKAYWYASTLHYNRGAPIDYVTARETATRRFLAAQREKGLI